MTATIRRTALVALGIAYLHVVFGAIVRISGSGMGCGENWPKCFGRWFPPLNRPDLIIEVSHRYLASILTLTVCVLAVVAWRARGTAGVTGAGGPLRSALGAVLCVLAAAILGAVTVNLGNAPAATVAHLVVAMTLLGMLVATAIRAGALGGESAASQQGSRKSARAGAAAAGIAFVTVALGGLTAKFPGAPIACLQFPLCGANPTVGAAATAIQVTHRILAIVLILHLLGVVMATNARKAQESPVVLRAARIAFGLSLLQLVVAGAMIGMHLPARLRSIHEATGVAIWIGTFTFAYLARWASREVTAPDTTWATQGRPSTVRLRSATR